MKKLLLPLIFSLSLPALAATQNEAVLKSLTKVEGAEIAKALNSNVNNLSQYKTDSTFFRAYPFYRKDNYNCRDVVIAKHTNYGDMTACNIGGDWVFIFE